MAACVYYSAMIKGGMSPEAAIVATRDAAGEVGKQPKRKKEPFEWEPYLKEHYPELEGAILALRSYTGYRAEMGWKRWAGRTWKMFLGKWQGLGARALEQSIERSVANGWQGVFEPKGASRQAARVHEPKEVRRAGRNI